MSQEIKNSNFNIRLPLLLALAITGGILIGFNMPSNNKAVQEANNGYLKFREILTHINQSYVDSVDTEELTDFAITKMLEKLDPHTVYIPAKEVAKANMQLEGDFEGIGVEFNIFRDTIYVVTPLVGGPSETAGIMSGDKIVEVDGEPVAGEDVKPDNNLVFKLLRGKKGSKVKLGIRRRNINKILYFDITRDKIPSYSVDVSYMIDKETGFIKVSRFAANTYAEFKEALTDLKKSGMKRLIIDLRGNPGGYMDRAIKMADELIAGRPKIVYTDGKGSRYDSEYRARINGLFEKGAVIVLIDEGSASASEIVAGALQDNDRALIIGRRSFGKGLVQMPIDLDDGSELRLTISRYYTPSGRSIQKPYQDYQDDYQHRLESGELFFADSVKVNDSLSYKTANGRTVYGGGGIIPDIFVPSDTSSHYRYLNILTPFIREYALNYYNDHRSQLEAMDFQAYRQTFAVSDKAVQMIAEVGNKNDIPFEEASFAFVKPMMKQRIKALIARSVWGNKGYYRIISEDDEIYQKALQSFDKAKALEKGKF